MTESRRPPRSPRPPRPKDNRHRPEKPKPIQKSTGASSVFVAKTLFGLEDILAEELKALGARGVRPLRRAVEFDGDRQLLYKANLCLRTANRVLVPIAAFDTENEATLYRTIHSMEWERHLDAQQTLVVDTVLTQAPFENSHYVSQKVKDAICDRFRERTGRRPSVNRERPDLRINLFIQGRRVSVSLDASGAPLNQRGYRTETGEAPLNEILAAGILAMTGWDGRAPFVDAMCGSGTLPIEAALRARRIAPGLERDWFGFMGWKDFDADLFRQVRDAVRAQALPRAPGLILASDRDASVLRKARANAQRAGVSDDLRVTVQAFEEFAPPPGPGVLIINPPYGERLQPADLIEFYQRIGDTLKQRYAGYRAFVLTGALEAAKQLGLRPTRRIPLRNGPLDCRLLQYDIYEGSRRTETDNNKKDFRN